MLVFRARNSNGLLLIDGPIWKNTRSALVPTFTETQLKSFIPAINNACDTFIANLDTMTASSATLTKPARVCVSSADPKVVPSNVEIEISEMWASFTFDVIGQTNFGMEWKTQARNFNLLSTTTKDSKIESDNDNGMSKHPLLVSSNAIVSLARSGSNTGQLLKCSYPKFIAPWLIALFAGRQILGYVKNIKTLDATGLEVTQQRRANPALESRDFVSFLLEGRINDMKTGEQRSFNDAEIRDHLNTFMFAGYETTSSTLTFASHLLCINPEKEAMMCDEIDRLLPKGKELQYSDLKDFEYVDAVVSETMRMHPVAFVS